MFSVEQAKYFSIMASIIYKWNGEAARSRGCAKHILDHLQGNSTVIYEVKTEISDRKQVDLRKPPSKGRFTNKHH